MMNDLGIDSSSRGRVLPSWMGKVLDTPPKKKGGKRSTADVHKEDHTSTNIGVIAPLEKLTRCIIDMEAHPKIPGLVNGGSCDPKDEQLILSFMSKYSVKQLQECMQMTIGRRVGSGRKERVINEFFEELWMLRKKKSAQQTKKSTVADMPNRVFSSIKSIDQDGELLVRRAKKPKETSPKSKGKLRLSLDDLSEDEDHHTSGGESNSPKDIQPQVAPTIDRKGPVSHRQTSHRPSSSAPSQTSKPLNMFLKAQMTKMNIVENPHLSPHWSESIFSKEEEEESPSSGSSQSDPDLIITPKKKKKASEISSSMITPIRTSPVPAKKSPAKTPGSPALSIPLERLISKMIKGPTQKTDVTYVAPSPNTTIRNMISVKTRKFEENSPSSPEEISSKSPDTTPPPLNLTPVSKQKPLKRTRSAFDDMVDVNRSSNKDDLQIPSRFRRHEVKPEAIEEEKPKTKKRLLNHPRDCIDDEDLFLDISQKFLRNSPPQPTLHLDEVEPSRSLFKRKVVENSKSDVFELPPTPETPSARHSKKTKKKRERPRKIHCPLCDATLLVPPGEDTNHIVSVHLDCGDCGVPAFFDDPSPPRRLRQRKSVDTSRTSTPSSTSTVSTPSPSGFKWKGFG
ncbi:hypothetical protein PROFUN_03501 [Planoprotostelium fungivorum]|uniref:Uncharacterized protein n=1 Tax=Planoprotostelium fungivorum TaxID=1890364 RepID=A0A2P6MNB1_9EUKA|nr:hypothetical protein PROFUN_03501 [Planoprotostelium fungivorum]